MLEVIQYLRGYICYIFLGILLLKSNMVDCGMYVLVLHVPQVRESDPKSYEAKHSIPLSCFLDQNPMKAT